MSRSLSERNALIPCAIGDARDRAMSRRKRRVEILLGLLAGVAFVLALAGLTGMALFSP
jgi:hypothetical protein